MTPTMTQAKTKPPIMARSPECQGLRDAVLAFLHQRSMTISQLCAAVYGHDAQGKTRGAGHIYPLVNGAGIPSDHKVQLIMDKVGLDLRAAAAQAQQLRAQAKLAPPPQREGGSKALTPVRAALAAHQRATASPPLAEPVLRVKSGPPLFALSIDQNGQSNVTLNLMGVDLAEALRCMATLTAANLIKVATDKEGE